MNVSSLLYINDDSQMSDQWDLYFMTTPVKNFGALARDLFTGVQNAFSTGDSFHIQPSNVVSVSLPIGVPSFNFNDLSTLEHTYRSRNLNKDFSITIREDRRFRVLNYFKTWANELWDEEKQEFKSGFNDNTREAYVIFKHKTIYGLDQNSCVFHLSNIKFKKINDNLDLNYDNGAPVTWTIEMIADTIISEPNNAATSLV